MKMLRAARSGAARAIRRAALWILGAAVIDVYPRSIVVLRAELGTLSSYEIEALGVALMDAQPTARLVVLQAARVDITVLRPRAEGATSGASA